MADGDGTSRGGWYRLSTVSRALGIDWGEKRIGVAVTDPMGWTARGLTTLSRRKDAAELEEIARLVEELGVDRLVVGLPVRDDGSPSASTPKVLAYIERLRARFPGLPLETCDESNTSVEANRILRERGYTWQESKKEIDRVAASVMLQAWLDERGGGRGR